MPEIPAGHQEARIRRRELQLSCRVMPILPLDHPEPFAATLGVMLHPGEDEDSRKRARAYPAQFLAEPLGRFHEAGGTLAYEQLVQIHSDAGVPLDDLEVRWRDGLATGELFKVFFALANTDLCLPKT